MELKKRLSALPQSLGDQLNTDCLPACRVCNGPGNGLHYGVNTCDACKGFFHRTIKLHLEYTCKKDSTCRIQHGRGKMCQHCRYQKCLSVGMSRLAIKTGRYTLSRKANCILEVKKQELMASYSNQLTPEGDNQSASTPDMPLVVDRGNTSFHEDKSTWSNSPYHEDNLTRGIIPYVEDNLTQSSPSNHDDNLTQSSPSNHDDSLTQSSPSNHDDSLTQSSTSNHGENLSVGSTPFHMDNLMSINMLDGSDMTSPPVELPSSFMTPVQSVNMASSPCSTMSLSPGLDTVSSSDVLALSQSSSDDLSQPPKSVLPETMSGINPSTPTAISNRSGTGSNSTSCTMTTSSQPRGVKQDSRTDSSPENCTNPHMIMEDSDRFSVSSSVKVNDGSPVSKMYAHKEDVISTLLDAHVVSNQSCKWTREELNKQAFDYYETCRMKEEMFGKLQILSEKEYDEVKAKTGMDADGRGAFLTRFLDGMESLVHSMVRFAKTVPGFLYLEMEDQINLIKYNRLEFNLLSHYPLCNVEFGVIRCQNEKWLCVNEAMTPELYWVVKKYLDIQGDFQKLKLSEEEQAVLKALSVVTPDRTPLTNKPSIHEIYRNLTDILMYCLKKRHKNPHQIFGDIMRSLTYFKNLEVDLKKTLSSLNLPKYSRLKERPLLEELVADFYDKLPGVSNSMP